ncbi:MAG: hypothetical protein GY858_06870 [Candidatus Omnitrophica bacterium]|nr:hypothetical protein [Candidatus Omnitrophota bacterium]
MILFLQNKKATISLKAIAIFIVFAFGLSTFTVYITKNQPAYASALPYMPPPTKLIGTSADFLPATIKGIKFYKEDPFKFDFILDQGDAKYTIPQLKEETQRLVEYFLTSLTVPAKDLWVNLSPHESDRVIPEQLGLTDMGRDMLGEDYVLKQLASSLTYPESQIGKEFWRRIYDRVGARHASPAIKEQISTYNKIWVIPQKAVVYEEADGAFLGERSLKVMMESDYVAQQHSQTRDHRPETKDLIQNSKFKIQNSISSQIAKEIILPMIEDEINHGAQFAHLRQIYDSLILATWFKKKLQKTFYNAVYLDQNKIKGVEGNDPQIKEKIYNQYVEAYKKGVYNYIKKDYDSTSRKHINRRYYSGGVVGANVEEVTEIKDGSGSNVTAANPFRAQYKMEVVTGSGRTPIDTFLEEIRRMLTREGEEERAFRLLKELQVDLNFTFVKESTTELLTKWGSRYPGEGDLSLKEIPYLLTKVSMLLEGANAALSSKRGKESIPLEGYRYEPRIDEDGYHYDDGKIKSTASLLGSFDDGGHGNGPNKVEEAIIAANTAKVHDDGPQAQKHLDQAMYLLATVDSDELESGHPVADTVELPRIALAIEAVDWLAEHNRASDEHLKFRRLLQALEKGKIDGLGLKKGLGYEHIAAEQKRFLIDVIKKSKKPKDALSAIEQLIPHINDTEVLEVLSEKLRLVGSNNKKMAKKAISIVEASLDGLILVEESFRQKESKVLLRIVEEKREKIAILAAAVLANADMYFVNGLHNGVLNFSVKRAIDLDKKKDALIRLLVESGLLTQVEEALKSLEPAQRHIPLVRLTMARSKTVSRFILEVAAKQDGAVIEKELWRATGIINSDDQQLSHYELEEVIELLLPYAENNRVLKVLQWGLLQTGRYRNSSVDGERLWESFWERRFSAPNSRLEIFKTVTSHLEQGVTSKVVAGLLAAILANKLVFPESGSKAVLKCKEAAINLLREKVVVNGALNNLEELELDIYPLDNSNVIEALQGFSGDPIDERENRKATRENKLFVQFSDVAQELNALAERFPDSDLIRMTYSKADRSKIFKGFWSQLAQELEDVRYKNADWSEEEYLALVDGFSNDPELVSDLKSLLAKDEHVAAYRRVLNSHYRESRRYKALWQLSKAFHLAKERKRNGRPPFKDPFLWGNGPNKVEEKIIAAYEAMSLTKVAEVQERLNEAIHLLATVDINELKFGQPVADTVELPRIALAIELVDWLEERNEASEKHFKFRQLLQELRENKIDGLGLKKGLGYEEVRLVRGAWYAANDDDLQRVASELKGGVDYASVGEIVQTDGGGIFDFTTEDFGLEAGQVAGFEANLVFIERSENPNNVFSAKKPVLQISSVKSKSQQTKNKPQRRHFPLPEPLPLVIADGEDNLRELA